MPHATTTNAIQEVFPYLVIRDAAAAIEFYKRVFGAEETLRLAEPKTQFYGERSSKLQDPFGHQWMLGQHIEDVSTDEMQRRYTKMVS